MRQIVFRKQARLEFDEAGDWYEKERPGLGVEFLAEIHLLIQHITISPELFPMLYRDVRKAVARRRFPYCIYFREPSKRSSYWPCSTVHGIWQYGSSASDSGLESYAAIILKNFHQL